MVVFVFVKQVENTKFLYFLFRVISCTQIDSRNGNRRQLGSCMNTEQQLNFAILSGTVL